MIDEDRICIKCGKKESEVAFAPSHGHKCKPCYNAYKRDYDARHPEKIRAINRRSYIKHCVARRAYSKQYTRNKRQKEKEEHSIRGWGN